MTPRFRLSACVVAFVLVGGNQVFAQTFQEKFGHVIDLTNLDNYANQPIPAYITQDNSGANPVTDAGATLGRILFYDTDMSFNRTTSCSSCHIQELAFSDDLVQSQGENGVTGRHSMRLINARFSAEVRFFWDERATSLEDQTTQPIQDHVEMGFSGTNGDPDLNALITRLSALPYYQELFTLVFGDATITESRMQLALAQFIRSIQSFDSKYDAGRSQVPNDNAPFPNFTANENAGKQLFLAPPQFNQQMRVGGGVGCAGCHAPPAFDIRPNSGNNGVIGVIGSPTATDLTNTRSPTLRDTLSPAGGLNTQMMHNGAFTTMGQVIGHYNAPPPNPAIDNRLRRPGPGQTQFNITPQERNRLIDFMQTLTGVNVYVNPKWSTPFVPPPPAVEDIAMDFDATSASMLTSLMVMFNSEVTITPAAITLTNITTDPDTLVASLIVNTPQVVDGKTMVELTFGSGASVEDRDGTGLLANTLANGNYRLDIAASGVVSVATNDPMPEDFVFGGQTASDPDNDNFFRLLGDANGDGTCNGADVNEIIPTLFNPGNYRADLDTNGDGAINGTDLNALIPTMFGPGRD